MNHKQVDFKDLEKEAKMIIAADKTNNYYKVKNDDYDELLDKNITKDYKKAPRQAFKKTVTKLELEDRIYETSKKQAFITLKDHKPNYPSQVM